MPLIGLRKCVGCVPGFVWGDSPPSSPFNVSAREASALSNDIPEESDQFRFLREACYANMKGSVGLILAEASAMRISIPLDLSSRPFIPLPCFMRSRRAPPLLAPSLVFTPR